MKPQIAELLSAAVSVLKEQNVLPADLEPRIQVDNTRDKAHGDLATNLAMMLAKPAGKNPRELAQLVVDALPRTEGDAAAGETAIEAGLADLRRCLLMDQGDDLARVLKHNGLALGAAEYALAEDSRYALASMPVTMECVEHYT